MISGSSIATTITVGSLTIPLMKKMGFSAEKAAAIEVSAGVNGQIIICINVLDKNIMIFADFLKRKAEKQ